MCGFYSLNLSLQRQYFKSIKHTIMTKLILTFIATMMLTATTAFFLLNARFKAKGNELFLTYETSIQRCENLPYGVYLDQLEEFNTCKKYNDSLRALVKNCSHIFDTAARNRCIEKNIALLEQLRECTMPIPPRYQAYLECKELNRTIRRQIPTCLPHKPNYEACLDRAQELYNQLMNCDSILYISELEYIKCKQRCNDMITNAFK